MRGRVSGLIYCYCAIDLLACLVDSLIRATHCVVIEWQPEGYVKGGG